MTVYGSDKLIDFSNKNENETQTIFQENNNAIVFTKLKKYTKYYVYFKAGRPMRYKARLTIGSHKDGNKDHPISKLTVGEHSRNSITLQPGEILVINV